MADDRDTAAIIQALREMVDKPGFAMKDIGRSLRDLTTIVEQLDRRVKELENR